MRPLHTLPSKNIKTITRTLSLTIAVFLLLNLTHESTATAPVSDFIKNRLVFFNGQQTYNEADFSNFTAKLSDLVSNGYNQVVIESLRTDYITNPVYFNTIKAWEKVINKEESKQIFQEYRAKLTVTCGDSSDDIKNLASDDFEMALVLGNFCVEHAQENLYDGVNIRLNYGSVEGIDPVDHAKTTGVLDSIVGSLVDASLPVSVTFDEKVLSMSGRPGGENLGDILLQWIAANSELLDSVIIRYVDNEADKYNNPYDNMFGISEYSSSTMYKQYPQSVKYLKENEIISSEKIIAVKISENNEPHETLYPSKGEYMKGYVPWEDDSGNEHRGFVFDASHFARIEHLGGVGVWSARIYEAFEDNAYIDDIDENHENLLRIGRLFLDTEAWEPDNCPNHCESCSNEFECEICDENYGLNDQKVCKSCKVNNCESCLIDFQVCEICKENFTYKNETNTCISCDVANCEICEIDDVCQKCDNGFGIDQTYSVGYLKSISQSDESVCKPCSTSNCQDCAANFNICLECEPNFEFNIDDECTKIVIPCPDNCKTCEEGVCSECEDNFGFENHNSTEPTPTDPTPTDPTPMEFHSENDSSCYSCEVDNCVDCKTDYKNCAACESGYSYNSIENLCKFDYECPPNCAACSGPSACDVCMDGFGVSGESLCEVCLAENCELCSTNSEICDTCALDFYLKDNSCLLTCAENCEICSQDLITNTTVCEKCFQNYGFNNSGIEAGNCNFCETKNCQDCYQNFMVCENCPPEPFYLYNNECLKPSPCNVPKCEVCSSSSANTCELCDHKYKPNSSGSMCELKECVSYCDSCVDENTCATCREGYGFDEDETICVGCSDLNCKTCSGSYEICGVCKQGMALIDGVCLGEGSGVRFYSFSVILVIVSIFLQ